MQRFQLRIGARTLVASCDPALHVHAESVLRLLGTLERQGSLRDGARIQLGWSQLAICARDEQLVICEPAWTRDPLSDLSDDITRTLAVLADQAALAQELGVAIQPTRFAQRLIVAVGALERSRIYLERKEPADGFDSGWHIGPTELDCKSDELEWEHMRVFELVQRRPAALRVLGLPAGYLVAFAGDQISTVLDADDRDIWAARLS